MTTEVRRREHDYEILVDGVHAGRAVFQERPGQVVLVHTEVDDAFEGQGVGSQLAEAVLADVRARGLQVVPQCPFIRAYIERHPEWQDLVATG
jgi:predicted GNAT family acetyltransferase